MTRPGISAASTTIAMSIAPWPMASDALDVPPTGLDKFFAQRRKLLLSHGWSDGLIPSQSTINFYEALRKDIGNRKAGDGVRLFMVPGMGHCAGGSGPSNIDYLGAIDNWVETGKPPEQTHCQ